MVASWNLGSAKKATPPATIARMATTMSTSNSVTPRRRLEREKRSR
jgi:hypothetical protein